MSNVNEPTSEQRLEAIYRKFKISSIFFIIGWAVYGFICTTLLFPSIDLPIDVVSFQLVGGALSLLLSAGPFILVVIKVILLGMGGIGGIFNVDQWRATVTDGHGNVSRDYGTENTMNIASLFLRIAVIGLIILITPFLNLIYMLILTFSYIKHSRKVSVKPNYCKNGLLLMFLNVIVFLASVGIWLGPTFYKFTPSGIASSKVTEIANLNAVIEAGKNASSQKVTAVTKFMGEIKSSPNYSSGTVAGIRSGQIVTITGEVVKDDSGRYADDTYWVPISHEGNRGYIYVHYLSIPKNQPTLSASGKKTATVTKDIATLNVIIPKGTVVTFIKKSGGNATVEYKGVQYTVKKNQIKMNK